MRNLVPSLLVAAALAGVADVARAEEPDRPSASVLRFSNQALLDRFAEEVRKDRSLAQRALALWRTHFAAQAAAIEGRFAGEEDWRPALADAAALVDDFVEAADLPRAGYEAAGVGQVWVERLDPSTGRRVRELRPAPAVPSIIAPGLPGKEDKNPAPGSVERAAKPGGK